MSNQKSLFLVDGHALAYRAYYALIRTPLTNAKGQPTGAVFGFANMLLHLLQEYQCSHIAVVFDSAVPTFREQMYSQYKANRSEMPDEMKSQIPLIFQLVEHFNLPILRKDGYEADDIIATLARKAEAHGYHVFIVSRDKDLMQLVSPTVTMLAPDGDGKLAPMGPLEVEAKMGVPPDKIRDLLALMGDSSDNIPGLPGVGPKTAVKILRETGDVELLLTKPECVGNEKLRQKIIENRSLLELSRELTSLRFDTLVETELDALLALPPDREKCAAFFKEMEFHSLLRNPLFEQRVATDFSFSVPATLEEVSAIVKTIMTSGRVSIDTETTSLEPRLASLVGISLAVNDREAWYLPVGHDAPQTNLPLQEVLRLLRPMIESEYIAKIGQNLKYDYQVFKNHGLQLKGIAFDTMVAAYIIDPGKRQLNMDSLAEQWLGITTIPIESLIGKGKAQKSFAAVPVAEAARYAGEDAVIPLRLMEKFRPILEERNQEQLFETMEMPLVTVLAELEWRGVNIDSQLLAGLSGEYSGKLDLICQEIYGLAGEQFNLNSPKQIADIFFNKLGMPKSKKTKTGLSTDVDALEKLAPDFPIASKLLEYRELQKLLSTYIDALPQLINTTSGRLHSSFNQTVTATGRLSSTNPNLQNIPVRTDIGRKIREAFVAPKGYTLVAADYSQIELRLLAHLSGDERLVEAFEKDMDIHTQTAAAIYGIFPEMVSPEMRRSAKTINFGLMYGMGPANLSRQLGISFKQAHVFIDTYFQQFPSIRAYMDGCISRARELGYCDTLFGRRRYLPEINADSRMVREAAERTAINTPVQGTAADIIKIAMVEIHKELPQAFAHAFMLLQVHDELIFEVPNRNVDDFCEWVRAKMSGATTLKVPLKVDVGRGGNWSEAH